MAKTRPNLPDVGHDRWWEIESDEGTDFVLKLMTQPNDIYDVYDEPAVIRQTWVPGNLASAHKFEQEAAYILRLETATEDFVGIYNKHNDNEGE